MTKLTIDFAAQAQGNTALLDELIEVLCKKRREEADARLALEHHVSEMKDAHRRKVIEYSNRDEYAKLVDPRTGRPNADFAEIIIEEAISRDPDMVSRVGTYYELQQQALHAQAELTNIADRIGNARAQGRVLAALMLAVAAESE